MKTILTDEKKPENIFFWDGTTIGKSANNAINIDVINRESELHRCKVPKIRRDNEDFFAIERSDLYIASLPIRRSPSP